MPKTKHKPGIHLYKEPSTIYDKALNAKPRWFWNLIGSNGREIARSSETYTRKANAVKSIMVAANIIVLSYNIDEPIYYDHTQPDSPLKSYL